MADQLPVTSLLSQVLIALTVETDNELENRTQHFTSNGGKRGSGGPWLISYAMYANFLRFVPDNGIRMADLAEAAGYGPPVHPAYHGMRRWGYVTYTPDVAGSSPKKKDADALVQPTGAGKSARDAWTGAVADVQQRWSERGLDALQAALIPVADDVDRRLPEYLPIIGFDRRQPELAEPVSRPPIDLDLLGLLSQVLLAMTYEFEARTPLALGTVSGLLQPLTEDPVLTRDLYEISGVATKEWSSAVKQLEKAGLAVVEPMTGGKGKSVRLTSQGVAAKDSGAAILRDVEQAWHKRCGPSFEKLRSELERVVDDAWSWTEPYPDGWRAKVRLPRHLAHHPIVSHRGGYPDGS